MEPALPLVGAGASVEDARPLLEERDAVMVTDEGRPVGLVTRADLLNYLVG